MLCHLSLAQIDVISKAVERNELLLSIPHFNVREVPCPSDPGPGHSVSS